MQFALLIFAGGEEESDDAPLREHLGDLDHLVRNTPKMTSANFYVPGNAKDKFRKEEEPPYFGMQLFFEQLSALEEAISPNGHLLEMSRMKPFASQRGGWIRQQAMYVRHFPVECRATDSLKIGTPCSYVVHYPGPASDQSAWMHHYISHHPGIMRTFPGIRSIEILTRIDWSSFLPWERDNHMQRNRVMFDSEEALTQALHSPARNAMREDFEKFPPFEGGNFHYPMLTTIIEPTS